MVTTMTPRESKPPEIVQHQKPWHSHHHTAAHTAFFNSGHFETEIMNRIGDTLSVRQILSHMADAKARFNFFKKRG